MWCSNGNGFQKMRRLREKKIVLPRQLFLIAGLLCPTLRPTSSTGAINYEIIYPLTSDSNATLELAGYVGS